jgi:hypothetical protein
MRGKTDVASVDSEQTCYDVSWALEFSPTNSYVAFISNGHRWVSTNPDVTAFMRGIKTHLAYATWESTDDIPTEQDMAYAILAGA